jgi:hypothetical protein
MDQQKRDSEKKVVRGRAFIVDNQDRKFGEDNQYIGMWTQLPDKNKDYALLFTEEEIEKAKKRGLANINDMPEKGLEAPLGAFDDTTRGPVEDNDNVKEYEQGEE